jgi:CheY-like chemotaxis protein
MDIERPNVSGFEFLEEIRKIPAYADTPIIIISGNSGDEFMEKAKGSSAAAVLTKPVKPDVLINAIEKAIA